MTSDSQLDGLEAAARVLLILGCGGTLMIMGIIAIRTPDATYPLRAGIIILLVLVLLLNKEQGLANLIRAWQGRNGGGGGD